MTDTPTEIDDADLSVRRFAETTLEDLRSGAMWAAWTEDGRPAYGDEDDPVPEGAEVVHDAEGIAVFAGIIVTHMINEATPTAEMFAPMNREQRRQRKRSERKKGRRPGVR